MKDVTNLLKYQLVVSCQASPNDPMEDTATLRRVARSAVLGGAKGLRMNSAQDISAARLDTDVPIIGIQKSYLGGQLRITPNFDSAAELAKAGADIIALDCTDRIHVHGEPWQEIVHRIHNDLGLPVMADIATLREGIAAAQQGADFIGTTLNGYTEETRHCVDFDPALVADLRRETGLPIIAEGHVSTPELAKLALDAGAWCVVVGSAITRPGTITASFMQGIKKSKVYVSSAPSSVQHAVAIDIGGTFVKAAIVSKTGEVQLAHQVATNAAEGRERISASLAQALNETLKLAAENKMELVGVGIASAGAMDSANGLVFAATDNLPGWAGFDLRGAVSKLTKLPVFIENDAQAAALAELHFGAGLGLKNFIALTVGTGIGGGVVMDGKLQRGQFGFGGTVGHQTIRFDGAPCNCGRRGCLEAYVSTAALIREFEQLAPDCLLEGSEADRARKISTLAAGDDSAAKQAYETLAGYLAEGLANLFNIFDPEAVILSGGLIEGQTDFIRLLQARVEELLHFGIKRSPQILRAKAGMFSGVQGAAATVFQQLR